VMDKTIWFDSPRDAEAFITGEVNGVTWYKDIGVDTYKWSVDGIKWHEAYGHIYGELTYRNGNNSHNFGLKKAGNPPYVPVLSGDGKMKSPLSNIRSVLGTIRPVDGIVGLRCDVTTAEEIWFEYVTRNDRKDFELVVESAPHGCNVFVRPWSESGMITGGAPSWVGWGFIAVFVLAIVGVWCYV